MEWLQQVTRNVPDGGGAGKGAAGRIGGSGWHGAGCGRRRERRNDGFDLRKRSLFRHDTRNFPKLTTTPNPPYHLTYGPVFIDYSMTAFHTDSPFVFFDASANTYIMSGASHFMNTETDQLANGGIVSGIQANVVMLPAGYEVTIELTSVSGASVSSLTQVGVNKSARARSSHCGCGCTPKARNELTVRV